MQEDLKLTITIENKEEIELFEFANAMSALNNQYYSFLNAKNSKKNRQDQKLLIKKISHGSVVMDLIEKAAPLLPSITPTLFEFTHYVCNTIDFLTGEKKQLYDMARQGYLLNNEAGNGDVDDFIHTQNFALVDKEKHLRDFYDGTDSVEVTRLIADIKLLIEEYDYKEKHP